MTEKTRMARVRMAYKSMERALKMARLSGFDWRVIGHDTTYELVLVDMKNMLTNEEYQLNIKLEVNDADDDNND